MAAKKVTKPRVATKTREQMTEAIRSLVDDWDLDAMVEFIKSVKDDEMKELSDEALTKLYREEVLGEEVPDA